MGCDWTKEFGIPGPVKTTLSEVGLKHDLTETGPWTGWTADHVTESGCFMRQLLLGGAGLYLVRQSSSEVSCGQMGNWSLARSWTVREAMPMLPSQTIEGGSMCRMC